MKIIRNLCLLGLIFTSNLFCVGTNEALEMILDGIKKNHFAGRFASIHVSGDFLVRNQQLVTNYMSNYNCDFLWDRIQGKRYNIKITRTTDNSFDLSIIGRMNGENYQLSFVYSNNKMNIISFKDFGD